MPAILNPAIKNYQWGDLCALPDLLGVQQDGKPWAELWYGTHPDGKATLQVDGEPQNLMQVVGDLSFLVKLVAVAKPLSLQTHPTTSQAQAGFALENKLGIDRMAPNRIYRDQSAKPELLCALGKFEMLCGFSPIEQSLARAKRYGWTELAHHLENDGLEKCVRWALQESKYETPANLPDYLHTLTSNYPNSGGINVALLMNHVQLSAGQAIYLEPGNVHSYLNGVAVEVMSNSDNVMRAAFTTKHIDLPTFFATANFTAAIPRTITPTQVDSNVSQYQLANAPFNVEQIKIRDRFTATAQHNVELLLCVEGRAGKLQQGQACILQHQESLDFPGPALIYRIWQA